MILEEISVENWRGFSSRHTFRFGEGINLLIGENEAGKSTLLEALWRTLFDRHTSSAAWIRDLQPEGTSLSPSATVQFSQSGRRYRAVKRFLYKPVSELWEEKGGSFRMTHEGDLSDQRIAEIAGGDGKQRGTGREHRRGISQALWFLQGEESLPEGEWNEAVREGLGSIVQRVVQTEAEKALEAAVEKDYASLFTPTAARIRGDTELSRSEERLEQIIEELKLLRSRRSDLGEQKSRVESLQSSLESLEEAERSAIRELELVKVELSGGEQLESDLEGARNAFRAAREEHEALTKTLADVRKRTLDAEALRKALAECTEQLTRLEVQVKSEQVLSERAHDSITQKLEPEASMLEKKLSVLHALERMRKLEKDHERLKVHVGRLSSARETLSSLRGSLQKLHAPSEGEWESFTEAEGRARVADAEVRSSSIRVTFNLEDSSRRITADPEAKDDGGEYSVDRPTTFRVEGLGSIAVRGGGRSLEDARLEAEKARGEIAQTLERFSVSTAVELASLLEKRRNLEREAAEAVKRLSELEEDEPDSEGELQRIEQGLREEASKIGGRDSEFSGLGGRAIRDETAQLELELSGLRMKIGEMRGEESSSEKRKAEALREQGLLNNRVAELGAKRSFTMDEVAAKLANYGSIENLEALVERKRQESEAFDRTAGELSAKYSERVEGPRVRKGELDRMLEDIRQKEFAVRVELADLRARIESVLGESMHSRIADLESEKEFLDSRAALLRRRAEGLRLLRDTLLRKKRERTADILRPVSDMVSGWFQHLTGNTYESVGITPSLKPESASRSDGITMPLRNLSYGTREQIIVLVRLAIGVLSSGSERNLVVLDDRLVNSDALRRKRMREVLEEASARCQLLVATCNEMSFAGGLGRTIRVPADGLATAMDSLPGGSGSKML